MKKTYLQPATEVVNFEAVNMMALSLNDAPAQSDLEVLTKEENAWDIWAEEEEEMVEE